MKKLLFKVLSVTLCLIMLFAFNASCVFYAPATDAQLTFHDDGTFRIMQIADIQDNIHLRRTAFNFMKYAIEKNNPDLIVLTGDNIAGYWNATGIFFECDETLVRESIDNFMSLFETYYEDENYNLKGVVSVFGNHDDQITSVSKEKQIEMYQQYPCYLGYDEEYFGVKVDGVGNYTVPIFKSGYDAKEEDITYKDVAYELYLIDSNSYISAFNLNDYDGVHKNQIDWFVNHAAQVNNEAERTINSMVFQHIIVRDIFDALVEVDEGTENAVEKDGKYYILPENSTGEMHEGPCPAAEGYYNDEYNRLVAAGTQAFCFGHDHSNSFVINNYKGADMIMTSGVGYCSYGDDLRGVRVIDLKEDGDNVTYTTFMDYIYDENGYSSNELKSLEAIWDAKEISFFEKIKLTFQYIFSYLSNMFK